MEEPKVQINIFTSAQSLPLVKLSDSILSPYYNTPEIIRISSWPHKPLPSHHLFLPQSEYFVASDQAFVGVSSIYSSNNRAKGLMACRSMFKHVQGTGCYRTGFLMLGMFQVEKCTCENYIYSRTLVVHHYSVICCFRKFPTNFLCFCSISKLYDL